MEYDLPLRIVLDGPPAGHAFCLQRGKGARSERLDYLESDGGEVALELAVEVRQGRAPGVPDFFGPFVQGTPGVRFFYLCVGRCSPDVEPHWIGRVKVPLRGIDWPAVTLAAERGCGLEASFAASRANGQPALASVPLLGVGWTVEGGG